MGFEATDRGDRSTEMRGLCRGEGESVSDLATPLPNLLTLGVAGEGLLLGVSDKVDLLKFKTWYEHVIRSRPITGNTKCKIYKHNPF